MKYRILLLTVIAFISADLTHAQLNQRFSLQWEAPAMLTMGYDTSVKSLYFKDAKYPGLPESVLPVFSKRIALPDGVTSVRATMTDAAYTGLNPEELKLLATGTLPDEPQPEATLMFEKRKPFVLISLTPFRRSGPDGLPSKLISFSVRIDYEKAEPALKEARTYASNSVLASGDWYKITIQENGIYKLTYNDMKSLGMNMSGINPANIRLFGNGGLLLNEAAGTDRIDDLAENAIQVVTATPGVFAQGDYILFYGQGTRTWNMNPFNGRMEHVSHFYDDKACYFITIGQEPGKRIGEDQVPAGEPTYYSVSYTAYTVHEKDNLNLIKSGRKWFGEKLDYYNRTADLGSYQFPDMIMNEPVVVRYGFAGRASEQLSYNILINDEVVATNTMAKITGSNDYARELTTSATYTSASDILKVQVKFNPPNNTALGWLDFVALNVRNNLKFNGGQLSFRDPRSVGIDQVTSFTMDYAQDNLQLWDVTDFTNVKSVPVNRIGNQYTFKRATSKLVEMVAFDGTFYMTPALGEKVVNQNLHATGNYDMIIITHPDFAAQAQRLAMLHNDKGDITATVISLPEIYNEFSSGVQDITAIRDFMKMLYDRGAESNQPGYLLLFGNASYDVKDRVAGNRCFIPTFQSTNSVRPVSSFLTDDYYGLLDEGEGANESTGLVDVISGRLPVRTTEQADIVVDRIEHYLKNGSETHGDWRNTLIFIADDQNKNTHLDQSENLAEILKTEHPVYNLEKIYFDAFRQVSTPGGSRYPDVNREIVTRVEKGALLTNYVGHGGEVGWADERVLEIADILSWSNYNQMGIFFTATCEFSRFDDPSLTSAGELVFLNPNGGAMSMITTTRLAFSSYNEALNLSFIDTAFNSTAGVFPTLGEILRFTKNDNQLSGNNRHMTLFGDPALRLPYARHEVVTTSVSADTLFANSIATVEGEVQDYSGQLLTGFNGILSVKVFDKPSKVRTLGQDNDSYIVDFTVQKSILYQGKVSVNGGKFTFTFPVPRDIDYSFGKGKISYYASDGTTDAHGCYNELVIGGAVNQPDQDVTGPEISLFVNDVNFKDGDYTNENPKLIALLHDESGINTAGNGIGHDIVATIDGDSYNSVLLNDYYVSDLDSYKSGTVRYQYFNLADGEHTLTLKAWDVYNNSSTATIVFNVKRNIILSVNEVIAYPNPSAGNVWFRFGHNQFDGVFTASLEVYSLDGRLIRTIGPETVASEGYVAGNIAWDGCVAGGQPARGGLYLCRLKVTDRNGNTTNNTVKVVLAR